MEYREFPTQLFELRKAYKLSQKKLAEAIGVSQASINYWEKGERTPSMEAVRKIAAYFDVPVSMLFGNSFRDDFVRSSNDIYALIQNAKHAACNVDSLKNITTAQRNDYFDFCKSIVDEFEPMSKEIVSLLTPDKITDEYIQRTSEIDAMASQKSKEFYLKTIDLLLSGLNVDGLSKIECYIEDIMKISEYCIAEEN